MCCCTWETPHHLSCGHVQGAVNNIVQDRMVVLFIND